MGFSSTLIKKPQFWTFSCVSFKIYSVFTILGTEENFYLYMSCFGSSKQDEDVMCRSVLEKLWQECSIYT